MAPSNSKPPLPGAGLPFFRITCLGLGGSGKTSLINSFISRHCPNVYTETEDPVLYYKVVKLQGDEDEDEGDGSNNRTNALRALVEIEDTYSSFRGDGKSFGIPRDVKNFLDMSRDSDSALRMAATKKGSDANINRPFSAFTAPKGDVYRPLTKGRMGFFIIFDANDPKSYEEALNIHLLLMEDMQKKRIRLKPVIYLVANKIDQNPHSDQFHQIITSAELYSQQKMIRFWQVSAVECVRVKKLFREMVASIRANQSLWEESDGVRDVENEAGDDEGKCIIQ